MSLIINKGVSIWPMGYRFAITISMRFDGLSRRENYSITGCCNKELELCWVNVVKPCVAMAVVWFMACRDYSMCIQTHGFASIEKAASIPFVQAIPHTTCKGSSVPCLWIYTACGIDAFAKNMSFANLTRCFSY